MKNNTFPYSGLVTANQVAEFLAVSLSGVWLLVKNGKIPEPIRISKRISRWNAEDIRLAFKTPYDIKQHIEHIRKLLKASNDQAIVNIAIEDALNCVDELERLNDEISNKVAL